MPDTLFSVFTSITVFALQGTAMVVDELVFHRRREMPQWERIGHPVDTLTVLGTLLLTVFLPPAIPWSGTFLAFAIVSCLFVTKDEWVHARLCSPGEQWLHAVLFILHPLMFFAAWNLWKAGEIGWLVGQCGLVTVFLAYQTVYWNLGAPRVEG
jgi:hypothetical protein